MPGSGAVIVTNESSLECEHVINASGAWSPAIFAKLGISIPVSVEPVYVVNWLTSLDEEKVGKVFGPFRKVAFKLNPYS